MDLANLNIFISAVRKRSFASVARELRVAPSVISRSIATLEEELGVKLFLRTTRRVSPTEAALTYFETIEPLVRELEQANVQLANVENRPQGTLRVSCPVSFADSILTKMLPEFTKSYPDLSIDLIASNTSHDLVAERIDVAIRYGHLRDSSLIATRLCALKETLCASPAYLAEHGTPHIPEDLPNHSCLLFLLPSFPPSWRFRRSGSKELSVSLHGHLRSTHAHSIKESAANGMGIALLPQFSIEREINTGLLVPLMAEYEATARQFDMSIWLVYASKETLPLRARVFIDRLKQFMNS